VVAVRNDVWTKGKIWMHSGFDEVRDFVRAREAGWRWWNNPRIARPMVSLVVVKAEDTLEPARPENGTMLRVRCAWENTTQGLLKTPISELIRLRIDGREVSPTLVSPQRPNGLRGDHHYRWPLDDLKAGLHTATADVRVLATGIESSRTITFNV
jgi:hypothetical protein